MRDLLIVNGEIPSFRNSYVDFHEKILVGKCVEFRNIHGGSRTTEDFENEIRHCLESKEIVRFKLLYALHEDILDFSGRVIAYKNTGREWPTANYLAILLIEDYEELVSVRIEQWLKV